MGRGRQKAKHTKVARELKYFSPETNLRELERELAGRTSVTDGPAEESDDDLSDAYADYTRDER